MFLMFINTEYEKAKDCLREGKIYEVHLVAGVGTDSIKHYVIPAGVFVDRAKPEIFWTLPASKKVTQDECQLINSPSKRMLKKV